MQKNSQLGHPNFCGLDHNVLLILKPSANGVPIEKLFQKLVKCDCSGGYFAA